VLTAAVFAGDALWVVVGTRIGTVIIVETWLGSEVAFNATLEKEDGIIQGGVVTAGGALGLADGTKLGAVVAVGDALGFGDTVVSITILPVVDDS
jgi:hypothetical protein